MASNALRVVFRAHKKKSGERHGRKSQDKSVSNLGALGAGEGRRSLTTPPEVLPILSSPTHSPANQTQTGRKRSSPLIMTVMVDDTDKQQGVYEITVDVQSFLAAISQLKQAIEESDSAVPDNEADDPKSQEDSELIKDRISDLVQAVQTCLNNNPGMQSTEITNAAKLLTEQYKECPHLSVAMCTGCNNAIDALIDAFTRSVSEYLTGETVQLPAPQRRGLEKIGSSTTYLKGFSKSHDNLAGRYNSYLDLTQPLNNEAMSDQIDQALSEVHDSVKVASKYLKTRIKYHREISSYLNRRAQIVANFHKQMAKLAKSTNTALDELHAQEPCLPMMDIFKNTVEQGLNFAAMQNKTTNSQVSSKITEPLEQKSFEYEKRNKEYTQTWGKEQKKLADARTTMNAARAKYEFLGQDLMKVKNMLAGDPYGKQADKRKKEVADTEQRWQDAEMAYKNSLAHCNDCQYQVHVAAKKSLLCAYRRIMIDADTQLREGLETGFTLQHNFYQTLPEPMAQGVAAVKEYEVGSEFMRYINHHGRAAEELEDYLFEEFDPEAADLQESMAALPNSTSSESTFLPVGDGPIERPPSPNNLHAPSRDGRSQSQSHASPRVNKRERPLSVNYPADINPDKAEARKSAGMVLDMAGMIKDNERTSSPSLTITSEGVILSKPAMTHTAFKKLRGPSRCRECDTYVYFHGFECETCGLACHRRCLSTLAIKCGSKRLARKMNTFGVDFKKHLKATKRYIPVIVTECIAEIDLRGLDTRGLYRVSSAKSKLEHLCQLFETGGDRVDLTDRPTHLIGSCLKLYFRQLPEPLLTFALYHDFVTFAREASKMLLPYKALESLLGEAAESAGKQLERLKGLLQKLPYENYITLAKLLYHLQRVSSAEHVKNNFMTPSNLGIVFAPNLLRQREMVPSLTLLADMTAQAKAVEIMISYVHNIIHVMDEDISEQEVEESVPQEVLVDDPVKSPILDIEDTMTIESRTPNTTPPERRRENVSELSNVLDALQLVSRRNSQPSMFLKPSHPQLGDIRNSSASASAPVFPNIPPQVGERVDTLAALSRMLRAPTHTPPMEKMLTPVQEKPIETDSDSSDDEEGILRISGSRKVDNQILSRSESGQSNSMTWHLFDGDSDVSSLRDSISLLSDADDTLSKSFRTSSYSINDSTGDRRNSREDLCEQAHLNHKGSSQGSDDSSAFADASSGVFLPVQSPTSPSEGGGFFTNQDSTPTSKSRQNSACQNHKNDSTATLRQTISTHSSISHGSSEDFESPDSTLKPSKMGRYERYERYRLANPAPDNETSIEQSQGSTHSTQDSVGTLTDGTPSEPGDPPHSDLTDQGPLYENGDILRNRDNLDRRREHWENTRDSQKQSDSGIDERGSPDTRSDKSNSLKRCSLPEIVIMRGSRLLSEPVDFNSRESGLADSPDSESFLSDSHPLNANDPHSPPDTHTLVTHVLRSPTEPQPAAQVYEVPIRTISPPAEFSLRERRSKSSEPDLGGSPHVEIMIAERGERPQLVSISNDLQLRSSNDSIDILDGDESELSHSVEGVPRSLESALFSSIARIPIQRHGKNADNPLYDSQERRPRASSVEPPALSPKTSLTTFTPKHEPHHKTSRMRSTTVTNVSSVSSPTHSTRASSSASSESDLNVKPELSKSLSALHSDSASSTPTQSLRKKKWGKRLQKTALRVLKITPNSTPSTPPAVNREDSIRDVHLSTMSPDPSPLEKEVERARMMSPEHVRVISKGKDSSRIMKRSQSFDDILDVNKVATEVPVTIGAIQVVPEPKTKSKRSKLFSSFQGVRLKSKRQSSDEDSSAVLVSIKKKSNADTILSDGAAKSPKTRKKSRLPHFV